MENQPTETVSALVSVASANDVTILADKDHGDPAIAAHLESQLPALKAAGVKHLYLEHDAADTTVSEITAIKNSYGHMVAAAEQQGFEIHFYDDRSNERARDAAFPVEAKYVRDHDVYFNDTDALIAGAPDPQRMRDYIDARVAYENQPNSRNPAIIANLDRELSTNPGEKAVVMLGAWHAEHRNDVDEGLRARGHQVSTIEVKSDNSAVMGRGKDVPDFIARTETGQAITYKANPADEHLRRIMEGVELPWRNTEPVADAQAGQAVAPAAAPQQAPDTGRQR